MTNLRLTRDADGTASFNGVRLPPGPWHDEPDHLDFRSPDGFACIMHRNDIGAWCGYVGVPPDHPWYGQESSAVAAKVHGGLTYAAHLGEVDDMWWLGFDCNHLGDLSLYDISDGRRDVFGEPGLGKQYRAVGYVRSETLSLADQASKAVCS